jgi:hypothetical protein
VANNWSRFDQFHELLYTFALADVEDVLGLLKAKHLKRKGASSIFLDEFSTILDEK